MGPTHFNVQFSCLCSIMINPTPTLTTTIRILQTHVLVHNMDQACRIWYHEDNTGFLHTCIQFRVSTTERLRLTLHTPITSPMQTQDPDGTTGRKMPPLWRDRQLVYPHPPPTRPRVPRHQAGQPGTSGVSNAVVGGEIDRGLCIHREGRPVERHSCRSWPYQVDDASCNPLMLFTHTADADFAMLGRVGRHASLRYFDAADAF